jgi:hypothetical protein
VIQIVPDMPIRQEEVDAMKRITHVTVLASVLAVGFAAGASAQKKEGHPVLQRAIQQIDNIRERLREAPQDFGGHKQKAIDALRLATDELNQARQFDK